MYYVIEGCAKCMVGNERWPGVDAGPCLNAGVQEVLKEINAPGFYFRKYGILLGGTFYHIMSPLFNHQAYQFMLNHLLRWISVDMDWCTLAKASLSVEATKSHSHLVSTRNVH